MITQKISIMSGEKKSDGSVSIHEFSKSERRLKAFLIGSIGLIISLVFVFIPILHLILVPFGFLITSILVFKKIKTERIIVSGQGECPACQSSFRILKRTFRFPFVDVCEKCSRQVSIIQKQ